MQNWAQRRGIVGADTDFQLKQLPNSVLVFGASGHIGGPLAVHLSEVAPHIRLRLATSSQAKAEALRAEFPAAEVVVADFGDLPTLLAAFDRMEGAFVVTPDVIEPKQAMFNVVAAAQHAGTLRHIVRLQGEYPQIRTEGDLPPNPKLSAWWGAQHVWARQVLEVSDLPITFLDSAAFFMDNFLGPGLFGPGVVNERVVAVPFNKPYTFIDNRDLGVAAANLLLSDDIRNIGMTFNVDNGHDYLDNDGVAEMLSKVLGVEVSADHSVERFMAVNGDLVLAIAGAEGKDPTAEDALPAVLARYLGWEQQICKGLFPSYVLEYLLGRKPVTFTEWIEEHSAMLLGQEPAQFSRRYPTPRPGTVHLREDGLSRRHIVA